MLVPRAPKAVLVQHTILPHHQSGPGIQSRAPESLAGEEGMLLKVGTLHDCWAALILTPQRPPPVQSPAQALWGGQG